MLVIFSSVYDNTLKGTIPSNISALSKLTFLDLSLNQLSGTLPLSLANLTFISVLSISHKGLIGEISSRLFANWSQITSFQLGRNLLIGGIPSEIELLTKLANFNLYSNNMSGLIPPVLGKLRNLIYFTLSEKLLCRIDPSFFREFESVVPTKSLSK